MLTSCKQYWKQCNTIYKHLLYFMIADINLDRSTLEAL